MEGETPEEQLAVAVAAKKAPIYTREGLGRELRQAEIISTLSQSLYNPTTGGIEFKEHEYSVVLTQDCDLLWDFEKREKAKEGALDSVLLYAAESVEDVRRRINGRDIWKRIVQNNDERYHLLEGIPADIDLRGYGMGGLIVDFKSFFTLTPEDVYLQCTAGTAHRRARLEMPYREHLQCRAAFYFQRVTLPAPHELAPVGLSQG